MNEIEDAELRFGSIDEEDEEEGGIVTIDEAEVEGEVVGV